MLNEADTRVKLIDPKLHASGWKEEQIIREKPITAGRILDEDGMRGASKKTDYVLLFSPSFHLAIVEAKDESHTALDGVQQAKSHAKDLDVLQEAKPAFSLFFSVPSLAAISYAAPNLQLSLLFLTN